MNQATYTLEQLYDLQAMVKGVKTLSPSLNLNSIATAFGDSNLGRPQDIEAVESVLYQKVLVPLDKALFLRKLYTHNIKSNPSKHLLIRSLAYVLFAKPLWFQVNEELARKIFSLQEEFDDMFFLKLNDSAKSFLFP